MIRTIGHALKECVTKSMLRSDRLNNYFTKTNLAILTATPVKRGRWSMSLLLSSVRELSLNGVSITNSTALSNAFNDHFSTFGSKLASEIPFNNGSCFQEYISGLSERLQLATRFCLFLKNWTNLNNHAKRAGSDGISSGLILDCADLVAPHISIIFNSSLANGIFPGCWKFARVTPLFKQGDRKRYRHLSSNFSYLYNWQSIWKNYLQSTLCLFIGS